MEQMVYISQKKQHVQFEKKLYKAFVLIVKLNNVYESLLTKASMYL